MWCFPVGSVASVIDYFSIGAGFYSSCNEKMVNSGMCSKHYAGYGAVCRKNYAVDNKPDLQVSHAKLSLSGRSMKKIAH